MTFFVKKRPTIIIVVIFYRYTDEGHIVEYSLVGPVEDFIKEAVEREQLTVRRRMFRHLFK